MSETILNPDQLKEIVKTAIVELLQDNREEVSDFLTDIIEDIALTQAITEGENSEMVDRASIFQLLET